MPSAKQQHSKRDQAFPTAAEILETHDFLDLWTDKLFLGWEFLTWLFLRTEEGNRAMRLPDGREVEVWFESRLQLTLGSGAIKRSVSVTTPEEPAEADWKEAYTAMELDKKVTRVSLRVRTGSAEWRFSLPHDTLSPQGIRFQASEDGEDFNEGGPIPKFLGRLALATELAAILDGLFQVFITLRLSPEWEAEEAPRLRSCLDKNQ